MTSLELDLSPFIDQIIERIVDQVTERLAERLFGPAPAPLPEVPASEVDVVASEIDAPRPESVQASPPPARKQRVEGPPHTCEICGRVGSRRYVQTPTGWKCSPTATACAPQFRPPGKYTPAPVVLTHPKPTPAPGVTAHCQDCTRMFTLTGRVLEQAIEMHELKFCHIVTVVGAQEAV